MSAAIPQPTGELSPEKSGAGHEPRNGRRGVRLLAALAGVLAAVVAVVVVADPFASDRSPAGVLDNGAATSLATVEEGPLTSQTQVSGTLGYAGSLSVVNQATGAATWLPSAGAVIRRGRVLYRVDGHPVVLMYGATPAYRTLKQGMTGSDVRQLNANLVALGYATSSALDPTSSYFSWETKYALELLQKAVGVTQTGELALGQAVFEPGAVRITHVLATLGTNAPPGGVIAQATSIARQVTVNLDAAQQASVKAGDGVTITLPNGHAERGVVRAVGKVASSGGSTTTIPAYIAPAHPRLAGGLDQAPVEVAITTSRAARALIVPVGALLALSGGGYAVETVDARGAHHLVAVTTGLFDDAEGLVQVSGALSAGEHVVVPTT
jgi:peptidoglycan hydrolase-like protein with peptidoglycan-binding domain